MSADNIKVAIKARPLLKKEKDSKLTSQWRIVNNSIQLIDSQSDPFCFDHIFDEGTTNRQIFNTVAKPIVDATLRGFNGTIFAYGQTSSGKTYTMVGDDRNPGVMIMAVQEIFKEIEKASDRAFLLRVGYIEIYNEKIYDLLNKKNQDLKIHETATGEVNINCTDFIITCEQDMIEHLCTGNKTRKISETNMNERSSRSHAIFRIIIESREFDKTSDETAVQISHLNLVDLAGSERADQTGATGSRLKEGCHINKSLLSLSCVINKLSENESDKYINYRDSKLTRILQASLGGNALTAIICTIKTTVTEETNSTLSFAMRAKSIKNKPHKNEVLSDAAMMKRLTKEITRLENELKVEKNKNSKIKIIQIERQIKDAELKIVHSHSVVKDRNTLRRRTWCPSSNTLPALVENTNPDNNDEQQASCENNAPAPSMMFLTPLITFREPNFPEQNNFSEEFIPGEEIEFSASDFKQLDTAMRTPLKSKNNNMFMTPTHDIKTKYEELSRDFEEMQTFLKLEKETSDAHTRIAQLEQERREYLKFVDDNHEKTMKLERARERCLELESRISELNEYVNILESKEESYQIKLKEYDQQVKSLLMASKDIESLEFEYEKYKENTKSREQELLTIINDKEDQISILERKLKNTVISNDRKSIDINQKESNASVVNKIVVSNNDNHSVDDTTIFTYDQKPNTSTKLQDESIISHVANLNLDSMQRELLEKDKLIKQLNANIEEMQEEKTRREIEYEELSTQVLDYVYENEKLQSSLKDTAQILEELQEKVQIYQEKEIILSNENNKLENNITELKTVIDRWETENVRLQSEIELLNVQLNRSLSEERVNDDLLKVKFNSSLSDESPDNAHKIPEEVGDNYKFTKEGAVSIIDEILNKIASDVDQSFSQSSDAFPSSEEELIRNLQKCKSSLEAELITIKSGFAQVENEKKLLVEKIMHSDESNRNSDLRLNEILSKISKHEADNTTTLEKSHSELLSLLDIEISNLLEKMEEIENINRDFDSQIKDFESKKVLSDGIENQLSTISLEHSELKKRISEYEDDKINLTKQISELVETNKIVILEKEDMEKEFSKLKYDVNEQNDFIRQMKMKAVESEFKIAQMNSESEQKSKQNDELLVLVEKLKDEKNNINSELDERNAEIHNLQTNLDKLEKNYDLEINDTVIQYKNSVQNLQSENKQIKENFNNLQVEMNRLREINNKYEEQISTMKEEITELSEKLKDTKSLVEQLEKSNNEFKENQEKLSLQLSDNILTKTNLEKDLQTTSESKALLEKEIFESKNKNIELNDELTKSRTLLHNMEQECSSLKESARGVAESLHQLQAERDRLKEMKEDLEKDFERRLTEECEQTSTEITNVRSENLILKDKMETLERKNCDLEKLLKLNVSRTSELEKQHKLLNEKIKKNEDVLKSSETRNEELEEKLSVALSDYGDITAEKEKLIEKILHFETVLSDVKNENVRLTKEKESIVALQKEHIEKATIKVDKMKVELEKKVDEHNLYKKENEEMKIQISKQDSVIRDLYSQLETLLANKEKPNESKKNSSYHNEIEIELLSLKEEHSKCLNTAKDKEELLKQLHEMQKMHVYKMKQYQKEINNLKTELNQKIDGDQNQKSSSKTTESEYYKKLLKTDSNHVDLNESEGQKIIKSLIGENDELRIKNQDLTIELQESRKLSQKDRKSKRQSTHDEKRPLLWNDSRDIGTMTDPTDKLCNCERLDRELTEMKKTLRIRDCQVNTLLMESKHNPIKEEYYEGLKKSIEEGEAENKELRRDICKLKNQIIALHEESKKCDKCLKRSMTKFVNEGSQTDVLNEQSTSSNTTAKLENDYLKIQTKYEDLKWLCRMRNSRILELENKLTKEKENETNNRQLGNNTNVECTTDSLSKELKIFKKKYEEAKLVCIYREKRIQTLEAELDLIKSKS